VQLEKQVPEWIWQFKTQGAGDALMIQI